MNRKRLLLLLVAIVLVSLEIVHVFTSEESIGLERSLTPPGRGRERPDILNGPEFRIVPHRPSKSFAFLYEHVAYTNLVLYEDMARAMTEVKSRFIPIEEDKHAFIAPAEFKAMADMYLSHFCSQGFTYPQGTGKFGEFCWYEVDLDRMKWFYLDKVKPGAVLYVDNMNLESFFKLVRLTPDLPPVLINQLNSGKLTVPIVLVSNEGDWVTPHKNLEQAFLGDTNTSQWIIHWYSHNCVALKNQSLRSKFTCIPYGMFNDFRIPLLKFFRSARYIEALRAKNTTLLLNYGIRSNEEEREPPWHHFCGNLSRDKQTTAGRLNFSVCHNITLASHPNEGDEYFYSVSNSKFVLSPMGAGPDCYRTWEVLLLGSYPIVREDHQWQGATTALEQLYSYLPVLVVKNWTEITPELLQKTYNDFKKKEKEGKFEFQRLFMPYWYNLTHSHKKLEPFRNHWISHNHL